MAPQNVFGAAAKMKVVAADFLGLGVAVTTDFPPVDLVVGAFALTLAKLAVLPYARIYLISK